MTVFLMTIRESLPPTEKTPLISFYYGVSICIVTFASAMAVVTLNIHHRGFRGVIVPSYVRFVCIKILGRILLVQADAEPSSSMSSTSSTELNSQLDEIRDLRVQLNGLHPTLGHRLDSRSTSRKYNYADVPERSPKFEPKFLSNSGTGRISGVASSLSSTLPGPSEEFEYKFGTIATKICESIERCEVRTKEQTIHDANQQEWKKVALVCDRFLFWAFAVSTAISTTLILFSSPYGPNIDALKHNIPGFEPGRRDDATHDNTPAITHHSSTVL
ncbi:unnamed protein product [Orchesella dallaii]|uniref:Neurotransmitter-gated ion-channel transmembrane domain-containing protein n=1 Tax=Orchesella dallaii TaxID=48710 RepID=A0ABP1QAQ3_9HEXA